MYADILLKNCYDTYKLYLCWYFSRSYLSLTYFLVNKTSNFGCV